jgi:16S rRNA (guanine(527)-N(7))-methyltransferase RsmG
VVLVEFLGVKKTIDKVIKYGLNCDEKAKRKQIINALSSYVESIVKWEKTHDLVSRKYTKIDVWDNVVDSVFLAEILGDKVFSNADLNEVIIDAGAGGGFPGLPLAIIFSERRFCLVDTDRKKCSFLRSVKALLRLSNITVLNQNIETIQPSSVLITKAAFPPARVGTLISAVKKTGRMVIWATPTNSESFIEALLPVGVFLIHRQDYTLPSGKKRSLLFFVRS